MSTDYIVTFHNLTLSDATTVSENGSQGVLQLRLTSTSTVSETSCTNIIVYENGTQKYNAPPIALGGATNGMEGAYPGSGLLGISFPVTAPFCMLVTKTLNTTLMWVQGYYHDSVPYTGFLPIGSDGTIYYDHLTTIGSEDTDFFVVTASCLLGRTEVLSKDDVLVHVSSLNPGDTVLSWNGVESSVIKVWKSKVPLSISCLAYKGSPICTINHKLFHNDEWKRASVLAETEPDYSIVDIFEHVYQVQTSSYGLRQRDLILSTWTDEYIKEHTKEVSLME
jgi:hypothetical protein